MRADSRRDLRGFAGNTQRAGKISSISAPGRRKIHGRNGSLLYYSASPHKKQEGLAGGGGQTNNMGQREKKDGGERTSGADFQPPPAVQLPGPRHLTRASAWHVHSDECSTPVLSNVAEIRALSDSGERPPGRLRIAPSYAWSKEANASVSALEKRREISFPALCPPCTAQRLLNAFSHYPPTVT